MGCKWPRLRSRHLTFSVVEMEINGLVRGAALGLGSEPAAGAPLAGFGCFIFPS